jgi:pre-mRNA-processing factor SLU7
MLCENCGGSGHKRRDCLERPRKIPAKYTGEVKRVPDAAGSASDQLAFDAKRDRWAGFSTETYDEKVREFEKKVQSNEVTVTDQPSDSAKTFGGDMMTVTNLRVREDTAKYLLNLDVNSAYYDPKSRAMRDDPNAVRNPTDFKGDNFVRYTGDSEEAIKARTFAWDSYKAGDQSTHELANPTATLKKMKEVHAKEAAEKVAKRQQVLEKYITKENE